MAIAVIGNRHLFFMIDKLIEFAKQHHPGFEGMPDSALRRMFEVYRDTTLVYQRDGGIRGFAIYQEWPDCLNFIVIVGAGSKIENLLFFLNDAKSTVERLLKKKICFFDEEKMELKIIKWEPQQYHC